MREFFQELLRADVYKKSQGRITRQVSFAAMAVTVLLGLWRFSDTLRAYYAGVPYLYFPFVGFHLSPGWVYYGMPGVSLLACWWISYRAVNWPAFADFLIAVEAEMNKVSWPGRGELFRASVVVMVSILVLGFVLFAFDFVWIWIFRDLLQLFGKPTA